MSESSFSYGVDWSDRVDCSAHSWLPYTSDDASSKYACKHSTCAQSKPHPISPLVECPTCSLIVHTQHIIEASVPPCRLSFIDHAMTEDRSLYDRHHWSSVSVLPRQCLLCQSKAISSKNFRGLVCLWCSRTYDQTCWEEIKEDQDKCHCDYGPFGNIVVRPQWLLRRATEYQAIGGDPSIHPVIFFINKLSGGQKGEDLYRQLLRLVNPRQVFLLENDDIIVQAAKIYASLSNVRICICGGDGTVSWVLCRLADLFPGLTNPPAGIFPLGTGNDMSRELGWGPRYHSKKLFDTLMQLTRARPTPLDRWQINFEALDRVHDGGESKTRHGLFSFFTQPAFIQRNAQTKYENHRTPVHMHFVNYISFGLDAALILDFHVQRTRDASKFTSPIKNKFYYMNAGRKYLKDFLFGKAWHLNSYMRLICDGEDRTEAIRAYHTIVLLNISTYGSGTHPWDERQQRNTEGAPRRGSVIGEIIDALALPESPAPSSPSSSSTRAVHFEQQNSGDQQIEVLGLSSAQMALIYFGFRGDRIAQCRQVRLEFTHPMPAHIDGEPFYIIPPTAVNITHAGQVSVLRNELETA